MRTFAARALCAVLAQLATCAPARAQPGTASGPAAASIESRPRLFLSCGAQDDCHADFLRQALGYFDVVRDPYLADLTIVIVRQGAGGGGQRWSVALERPRAAAPGARREVTVPPGAPAAAAREALLQAILRALQTELSGTAHADAFQLALPARDGAALSRLPDPWDYWVLAPELRGKADGASGYFLVEGNAALHVRRVTEEHKLRVRLDAGHRFSSYRLEDGTRDAGLVRDWEARALHARSLGRRWALGATATAELDDYENLRGHLHGGPLVEFNLFPYAENASRQLRFAYQAGAWANAYRERTRAGRLRELRPYQAVTVVADGNRAWGSVQWVLQLNTFLDDPRLYRLSSGVVLTLRLHEGLALSLQGQAAHMRDLINLRGRPITDREILLWTAQQPTGFTVEATVGLSYTFGSIYNTVVNPRFGRVDLEDD